MLEPILVLQEECGGVEVGGGLGPVHADEGVAAVKPAARLYQPRDVAQLQLVGVVSPPRLVVPLQKYFCSIKKKKNILAKYFYVYNFLSRDKL